MATVRVHPGGGEGVLEKISGGGGATTQASSCEIGVGFIIGEVRFPTSSYPRLSKSQGGMSAQEQEAQRVNFLAQPQCILASLRRENWA